MQWIEKRNPRDAFDFAKRPYRSHDFARSIVVILDNSTRRRPEEILSDFAIALNRPSVN